MCRALFLLKDILSEKSKKINDKMIEEETNMKKTKLFSLIALVMARLMVVAACTSKTNEVKENYNDGTTTGQNKEGQTESTTG